MAKIKFDLPENKKKITIELKESEMELVHNYCYFLTRKNSTGKELSSVKPDILFSGLLKPLAKDKEYLKFVSEMKQRVAAISGDNISTKKVRTKNSSVEANVEAPSV